jgi:TNF receptor-associated protein 1
MNTSTPERHEFQAEIKQLLDIVVHSLYTEKEIFIRELVSNASDALEKFRHLALTEKEVFDDGLNLEINITTDDTAKTITIQDFGLGMTHDELVENLGTIAHSDSKKFLDALKEGGQENTNLIGQFGVGFYSTFMVAKQVKVYSRSWQLDGTGHCWSSDGSGAYEIEEVEGQRRGTKIVVELSDESKDFASADKVKGILRRYSSFVPFPINLNGDKTNTVQALWLRGKSEIKDEEYTEFYKFQANAFDDPRYRLHFSADAPLAINSLLFVPSNNIESFGMGRSDPSVALYCRKVLIDPNPKDLLPEWLRFLKGVVDSEDLPLNISRETMQDRSLVEKLNRVITGRFLRFLDEEAVKRSEDYLKFYGEFSVFLKEGAATDFSNKEKIAKLLRFESSLTEKDKLTGFDDYISRMKDDQKDVYYLIGPNRDALESAPYLEAFKARNLEVLFLYEAVDEFVMSNLREYKEKKLVSVDQSDIELEDVPPPPSEGALDEETTKKLCLWIRDQLGERVAEVSGSKRLIDSPAMALNADKMMNAQMRRMMKAMNQGDDSPIKINLEINPRHPLVARLNEIRETNPELGGMVVEQVFDNAMISAGLLEDPRTMVDRIYKILETVSGGSPKSETKEEE